jgi:hypothetical protein
VTLCGLNSPELRGTSEPARVNCETCFQTWHRLMRQGKSENNDVKKTSL